MARKDLIQHRRDTAANWTSVNPILASSEIGYETDTGKFKFGDGVTAWTSLTYQGGGTDTLATVTSRGATTSSAISITNTTDSTNTSSGSLILSGGLGVAKKLYVGGTLNISNALGLGATPSYGTVGQVLTSTGSGSAPTWSNPSGGVSASNYVTVGALTANQTIASAADTVVTFSAFADPQGWWNSGTYRFTPTVAGYYSVSFQVFWGTTTSTSNQTNIQIRKNGNTHTIVVEAPNNTVGHVATGSRVIYLNGSTDYLDFSVYPAAAGQVIQSSAPSANGPGTNFSASLVTSGANITSNQLTIGSIGLTTTAGASPWNGSVATTIDIDSTKVPLLTASQTFTGLQTLTPSSTSTGALLIKQLSGQTGALFNVQNSLGTNTITINSQGEFNTGYFYTRFGGGGATSGLVTINPTNNIVPLAIRGVSSQSSNLQEWQNSSGTVLSKVDASGNISAPNMVSTYIQSTQPSVPAGTKYMWWDTTGGNLSLWIEDGT